MTRISIRWAVLLAALGLMAIVIVAQVAKTGDTHGRTTTLGGLGGGTEMRVEASQLPQVSDVAVRGEVARIGEVLINTSDQRLPDGRGRPGIDHLLPYTVVEVRVQEVLGARPGSETMARAPGETMQVVVLGGTWTTRIPFDEAKARGYESDVEEVDEQGFVDWSIGVAASTELVLGEEVVLFLREHAMPVLGADGVTSDYMSVLISAAGSQGVFHRVDTGWQVRPTHDVANMRAVFTPEQIEALATELDSQSGEAREPNES